MAQIIAGTYEILKRIGSGGGGVVYLGHHIRLNKMVAIKADKRTLTANPEKLNQEVNILKELNQTYIPQVYDFVYQDGIVYSVIDYIEGESLDKLLKRGETISQPRLIKWTYQLLEALQYLHSRPPYGILHGDIKPANIMLTPEDDIRLIDFNIALALGERGAIRLGYSSGYASPEHYAERSDEYTLERDQPSDLSADPEKTELMNSEPQSAGSARSGGVLDARSDIYMLGATLYHLISGIRPAPRAEDVVPLPENCCDRTVAQIIQKAMAPRPEDRYQSAEEMIIALDHLYENDPASIRLKNRRKAVLTALVALFLLGGAVSFSGVQMQKNAEQKAREAAEEAKEIERLAKENERNAKEIEQRAKRALELVTESRDALDLGTVDQAVEKALEALSLGTVYDGQAQYALTDALGVYDLAAGYRPSGTVELPSGDSPAFSGADGSSTVPLGW